MWNNEELISIVLNKPLKVYKIGVVYNMTFISAFRMFVYTKNRQYPTVKLIPQFRISNEFRYFRILEGYHAYLTFNKAMSEIHSPQNFNIGVFEIPRGATIYINFNKQTIISSNIKYLYPIEVNQ